MLPPEKDDEPGKPDESGGASSGTDSPTPRASASRRRRKAKPSQTEDLAAAESPETVGSTQGAGRSGADGTAAAEVAGSGVKDAAISADDPAVPETPAGTDRADDPAEVAPIKSEPPQMTEPEPAPRPYSPPAPPARRGGGGFLSSLLAAIIGGMIGAGGIWYYLQQQEPAGPDPAITSAIDEQRSEAAAQADRLTSIEGDIGSLNEALSSSDMSNAIEQVRMDAEGRIDGVADTVARLGDRLDAMQSHLDQTAGQIADLEARPIADPETANQVLRSEVADMRNEVQQATDEARTQVETMRTDLATAAQETQAQVLAAEQRAADLETQAQERIREAEAQAQDLARSAVAEAALAQIQASIDSGEPYSDALATLTENGGTDVPAALVSAAETGVPTVIQLRESYPDAARAALRATAVASTEGEPAGRLAAFLRSQTQARSLTPREGDGPDAILSRAEAALGNGDVTTAVTELDALPEDGRQAMQGWIDEARRRAEAIEAAESLSQNMN